MRSSDEFQKCLTKIKNLEKENKSLKMKLHAVEESIKDEELPSDHKVALSEHVSLRLRRNSNNLEIDKLRQQLHLIKTKIEHHKRAWIHITAWSLIILFIIYYCTAWNDKINETLGKKHIFDGQFLFFFFIRINIFFLVRINISHSAPLNTLLIFVLILIYVGFSIIYFQ